jgi:hypothetical protein
MRCKEVEMVLEQEGLEPLPREARAHLAECRECRDFVSDLTSIVDVAGKLPQEIAPPERVWVSLRAQLEAEGIIKTPADVVIEEPSPWWQSLANLFRRRALATATVGLLIVGAAVLQLRTGKGPENVSPQPSLVTSPNAFDASRTALDEQEPAARGMILSSTLAVDTSLRQNLQELNEFIAVCEQRIKEVPGDELAREYLRSAYQQKAELLSEMLDRGRSVN